MSTRSRPLAVTIGLSGWLLAAPASAQAPALPPPPANAPSTTATDTTPIAVPDELLRTTPGGSTATQAGDRAAQTSWSAKAAQATLVSAAARVDGAWAAFLPRLTATGKYTRLSNFTPPSFGSGNLVGTDAGGALLDPATFYSPTLNPNGPTHLFPFAFSFPLVLNNYLLQANITVPISDYLFRIDQTYTAATHSREAAHWDVVTARAASQASGRVAYYTWMNARGAVIVAVQTLNDQKTHLRDARNQFAAGNASKADELRADTAVASADLAL